MPFTADELADINNAILENYIDKGTVWKQNVANKPMLDAFNASAGKFSGGKENVSFAVKSGQGGGTLQGYSHDDQVGYYNPTGLKRARFPWREHHIGITVTHTELKTEGVDVTDTDGKSTRGMDGREEFALANLLEEKMETLGEDYAFSLDRLIHGDGSADAKALAGIRSLILDNPNAGATGGINRVVNSWWRNRAATTAFAAASGQGPITVNPANGGALIEFMDKEVRARSKYKNGSTRVRYFCGSDFIDGYKRELRANGYYSMNMGSGANTKMDGSLADPNHGGLPLEWDPTLDDLGFAKRCYAIDMGRTGVRLLYMDGQRMKKHTPSRPYDRYTMYNGITTTGVMIAKQLNTSGVYDIA